MQGIKITTGGFTLGALVAALCFLHSPLAAAHARWDPNGIIKPRDASDTADLKTAPCGTNVRTATPATFAPGQTLEVTFQETVQHLSHFRIAFSPAGDTGFDSNVLLKDIVDDRDSTLDLPHLFHNVITLPTTPCDACTLQLIQVMVDNPNSPSNYYSCSDIKLVSGGGTTPTPTPAPTPPPALNDLKQIAQILLDDFSAADTDRNSALSLAEAQMFLPQLKLSQFVTLDINANGALSIDELNAAINPPAATTAPNTAAAASMEWTTLLALLPFAFRRFRKSAT